MEKLPGLRFAAGILFIAVGIASIMHIGPAYLLWWSGQAIGLYSILLLLGIGIIIMPYFYRITKSERPMVKDGVVRFDFALGLSSIGVGYMLLMTLIFNNPHWPQLQWIPVVLAIFMIVEAYLFRTNRHMRT